MSKTRIGFVGAGFIATRHADILRTFDDVRVVAVADPDLRCPIRGWFFHMSLPKGP